jgi:hypothetical protein
MTQGEIFQIEKGVEKYYIANIMEEAYANGETERTHDDKENR